VGRETESLLSALSGTGKGVDADAAVAKGGCESGFEDASEGERFKEEDSLSESSSMRAMVICYGGLKKVEVPRPNVVGLSEFGNKLSTVCYLNIQNVVPPPQLLKIDFFFQRRIALSLFPQHQRIWITTNSI